jgi:hypothetical protein
MAIRSLSNAWRVKHAAFIDVNGTKHGFVKDSDVGPPSNPEDFPENALELGTDGLVYFRALEITATTAKAVWQLAPTGSQAVLLAMLLEEDDPTQEHITAHLTGPRSGKGPIASFGPGGGGGSGGSTTGNGSGGSTAAVPPAKGGPPGSTATGVRGSTAAVAPAIAGTRGSTAAVADANLIVNQDEEIKNFAIALAIAKRIGADLDDRGFQREYDLPFLKDVYSKNYSLVITAFDTVQGKFSQVQKDIVDSMRQAKEKHISAIDVFAGKITDYHFPKVDRGLFEYILTNMNGKKLVVSSLAPS